MTQTGQSSDTEGHKQLIKNNEEVIRKNEEEKDLRSDFTQDELEKLEKEGWTLV